MKFSDLVETVSKLRTRLRQTGSWRTLSYAAGVYVLPRVGVHIKHVFVFDADMASPQSCEAESSGPEFLAVETPADLTPDVQNALSEVDAEWSAEKCQAHLACGRKGVVAIDRASRAGMAMLWWEASPPPPLRPDEMRLLIRDVATTLAWRGRGIGVALLRHYVRTARERAVGARTSWVARIYAGNDASTRMFHKVGFRRAGISLALGTFEYQRLREVDGSVARLLRGRRQ